MDKLYLVIPAYNEQEMIRSVIEEWYPQVEMTGPESRLVIVDDGSTDNTPLILKEEEEKRPQLIVKRKENSGHGATILLGYRFAIREGADYIFQTDSDGQTDPAEFRAFWEKRAKYDMIVGHRNRRQDGLGRIIVTKVLKLVILLCFHVWVKDANTPFRLMKAQTLREEMKYVPREYFLANVLISVIYAKHQHRVCYIPISFRPRQGGKNFINIRRIVKVGFKAIGEFVKLNRIIRKG